MSALRAARAEKLSRGSRRPREDRVVRPAQACWRSMVVRPFRLDCFGGPKLGAPAAGVQFRFLLGRGDGLGREDAKPGQAATDAWVSGRADATTGLGPEEPLDDAVLQRVEADDHEPAAALEQTHRLLQRALQPIQLVVDGDSKRLKDASGGVDGSPGPR